MTKTLTRQAKDILKAQLLALTVGGLMTHEEAKRSVCYQIGKRLFFYQFDCTNSDRIQFITPHIMDNSLIMLGFETENEGFMYQTCGNRYPILQKVLTEGLKEYSNEDL